MAFKILIHTFRMIFGNFGQALRVSVGPYLILILGYAVLFGALSTMADSTVGMTPLMSIMLVVLLPLSLFVAAWVAVSWHRFILLEEYVGLLPAVKDRPIWPYAGKAILMALILGLIGVLLVFCYYLLALMPLAAGGRESSSLFGVLSAIVFVCAFFLLVVVSLRMGPALVATALGKSMTFRDAVEATSKIRGVIWGVALLFALLNAILGFAFELIGSAVPILGIFMSIALNWLTTLLGISILTTIYGHVIEDRPLVS